MKSSRKRTYKEIEDNSKYDQEKIHSLIRDKENLENHLSEMTKNWINIRVHIMRINTIKITKRRKKVKRFVSRSIQNGIVFYILIPSICFFFLFCSNRNCIFVVNRFHLYIVLFFDFLTDRLFEVFAWFDKLGCRIFQRSSYTIAHYVLTFIANSHSVLLFLFMVHLCLNLSKSRSFMCCCNLLCWKLIICLPLLI